MPPPMSTAPRKKFGNSKNVKKPGKSNLRIKVDRVMERRIYNHALYAKVEAQGRIGAADKFRAAELQGARDKAEAATVAAGSDGDEELVISD